MSDVGRIDVLGVYTTKEDYVYLIEVWINDSPRNIDLSRFTLREEDRPEPDWQVPFDEQFLNENGTKVIGDYFNRGQLSSAATRVVFFLYVEDFSSPLSTPYGEMTLGTPTVIPDRLKEIVSFTPFD